MPRIFIDVGPLRQSRDFRLLFTGQLLSTLGSQLTTVAIPYQVFEETHSSLQVGAISLAQLVPLIVGSLLGGTLGDVFDRRRLLLVTAIGSTVASGALALNALGHHPSLLGLYLISALAAGLAGVANPARNAAIPSLVAGVHLIAALAFMQIVLQLGTIIGPACSGLLLAAVGLPAVYAIDAVSFLAVVVSSALMAPIPPAAGTGRPGIGSLVEGMRYVRRRPAIGGAYLIDVNAMVFGMPRALFPALTLSVFHGGASTLGLLYAAPGAGALLGALTTGWLSRVRRQGWGVTLAVVLWGVAVAGFGLVHVLWAALALLAVAGWADVISAVLRNTIIQAAVSEAFRSRLSSFQMAVVQGGPRLGDFESGAVGSAFGTEFSIVSGGIACVIGAALLVAALPGFRHHRSDEPHQPERTPASAEPEPSG